MIYLLYPLTFFFAISSLWWTYAPWIYFAITACFMGASVLYWKKENKKRTVKAEVELSYEAKQMLEKFSHIYELPFASRCYASISGVNQLAGVFVMLVQLYQGYYWTLLFTVVNWYFFAYVAYYFNPLIWFEKNNELHVHEEIVDFYQQKIRN